MTMLDDIKQAMHDAIDKAWEALHGTHDLEAARPIAQATTEALHAQALQVEAQLIKHVADNAVTQAEAEKPATEPAATVSMDPTMPTPTMPTSSSESLSSVAQSTTSGSEPSRTASATSSTTETE
jgi:hypothetical protein